MEIGFCEIVFVDQKEDLFFLHVHKVKFIQILLLFPFFSSVQKKCLTNPMNGVHEQNVSLHCV